MEQVVSTAGLELPGGPGVGAMLVVDVQRSFGDPDHLQWIDEEGRRAIAAAVDRIAVVAEAFRTAGGTIVWVQLISAARGDWPASLWIRRISPDATFPPPGQPCVEGTPGAELYGVTPAAGDLHVFKRRYSSFWGTGLEDTLADRQITWLTVVGLTTECCVHATAVDAAQNGFATVVLRDATASYERAVHTAALTTIETYAARLTDSAAFLEAIAG